MQTNKLKATEAGRIVFRDEELLNDIKSQAAKEGYRNMESYLRVLHSNRKIYLKELLKPKI